jgi:hypothetical protein
MTFGTTYVHHYELHHFWIWLYFLWIGLHRFVASHRLFPPGIHIGFYRLSHMIFVFAWMASISALLSSGSASILASMAFFISPYFNQHFFNSSEEFHRLFHCWFHFHGMAL